MDTADFRFSIVIPCFNEVDTIKQLVQAVREAPLPNKEIIVVDDFSTDGTRELLGVELKTVPDFVDSIIDGRLLEQAKTLVHNYERPLIVVQGTQDIYAMRNIHPNAIRGMLSTIAISYGIPIIHTRDEHDTAALLQTIARREQEQGSKEFSVHANKKPLTWYQRL